MANATLAEQARAIWDAAVEAVRPEPLVVRALSAADDASIAALRTAPRIWVVGAGKAGSAMATGVEAAFADRLDRLDGWVNVPAGTERKLKRIRLHTARPVGVNEPTAEGIAGAEAMLSLLRKAGPNDAALCLISGGGSALLPAPVEGVSLPDKQAVTKLLHRSGATIHEMNAIRKHLSRVKGGRLAEAFNGRVMLSLIVSDVVGDPLDVIASGPTAADPTTFADALNVLDRFNLRNRAPASALAHLERGTRGEIPETPKAIPNRVVNRVIASNAIALAAAEQRATALGYKVINLGPCVEGETKEVAIAVAGIVRGIQTSDKPASPSACILIGGETTVALGDQPGRGGRNQEFVLAMLAKLGCDGMRNVAILSGGTDGEDGPTDAAGAVADADTFAKAEKCGLSLRDHLDRHDAYPFFENAGGLIRTGLTETNVMDVRVVLVGPHHL